MKRMTAVCEMEPVLTMDEGFGAACYGRSATLVSFTTPADGARLSRWLQQATGLPRVYWADVHEDLELAGSGVALTLSASGPGRFQHIQQQARQLFQQAVVQRDSAPQHVGPRLLGGFRFQGEASLTGIWSAFGAAHFMLPRYLLTAVDGRTWLTISQVTVGDPLLTLDQLRREAAALRRSFRSEKSLLGPVSRPSPLAGHWPWPAASHPPQVIDPLGQESWQRMVAAAVERIRQGQMAKVVLARPLQLRSQTAVDPLAVLNRLGFRYRNCYRFLFEPRPGHAFYGATPELLARVHHHRLETAILAGSIRRGSSPREDDELAQQLMSSPKERLEHGLVVQAGKESLLPLVTGLHIPPQPAVYRLNNIQHLYTPIRGELRNGHGVLAVVQALHPTPAVGGLPREAALDFIGRMEIVDRGWYAGPIGWIDQQGQGTFAVAIRSAVSVGRETWLYAGAGIVAGSVPEREWAETRLKFRPLLEALGAESVP